MAKKVIGIEIKRIGKKVELIDSLENIVEVKDPQKVFEFLLKDYNKPDTFKVTWNLYSLVDIITNLIPEKDADTLLTEDRVEVHYNEHTYRLFSSPGRMFAITHKWVEKIHDNFQNKYNQEVTLYGLSQYFPDEEVSTAKEIESKGNYLLQTLFELGFNPTKLSSAIAIYESQLENAYIPTVFDLPDSQVVDDMVATCYKAMNREWRSTYRVGHFPIAWDHDLCGAYPSLVRDFGDTNNCKIWYAKSFQKCDFGVVNGKIHIESDYSPIVNINGENVRGTYEDVFPVEQIGFLYRHKLGTFDLKDGYFLKFNDDTKPFYKLMTDLYKMRQHGGIIKTFAKNVSVGFNGKFSEEHKEKFGKYFNPIYSLMTTSRMAIRVGKLIWENNLFNDLISVMVDGCSSTKEVPCENTKEFGTWRSEKVSALVLSTNNQYVTNGNEVDKMDARKNTYSSMLQEIKAHPNKSVYNDVLLDSNMHALNRVFKNYPKTGKDLLETVYTSEPLTVNS